MNRRDFLKTLLGGLAALTLRPFDQPTETETLDLEKLNKEISKAWAEVDYAEFEREFITAVAKWEDEQWLYGGEKDTINLDPPPYRYNWTPTPYESGGFVVSDPYATLLTRNLREDIIIKGPTIHIDL